jgi:hypothetical protein
MCCQALPKFVGARFIAPSVAIGKYVCVTDVVGRDKSRPLYYNVARRFSIAPEEMELLAPLSLKLVT